MPMMSSSPYGPPDTIKYVAAINGSRRIFPERPREPFKPLTTPPPPGVPTMDKHKSTVVGQFDEFCLRAWLQPCRKCDKTGAALAAGVSFFKLTQYQIYPTQATFHYRKL